MTGTNFSKELAFDSEMYAKEREYWLNKLSGDLLKCSFPHDNYKTTESTWSEIKSRFSRELFEKMVKVISGSDSRLHMIFVAAVALLLNKYTGNRDIIVGTSIDKQDIEGDFINTVLALRIPMQEQTTFKELLYTVKETILEAVEHQNYPLETIPHQLNVSISPDEFPLFDVAVLLRNIHEESYLQHLKLNMIFSFFRTDGYIEAIVKYNAALYEKGTIERIFHHFIRLLQEAFLDVNAAIFEIDILEEKEKEQLLVDFNNTKAGYPTDKSINELFLDQVEKTPGNTALLEAETGWSVTYEELNRRALQLTGLLQAKGVKKGSIVPIMGKRKIEVIVGILAILNSGGIYLPMDGKNPDERIRFIIKDSGAEFFLTQGHLLEKKGESFTGLDPGNIIILDNLEWENYPAVSLSTVKPGDPAYIIYTSGTTGRPKGVMVQHQAVVNYIFWAASHYVGEEVVHFPLYTSISFDLTVTSIFVPLVTGGAIVLYEGEENEFLIEKIVEEDKVGIIKLTPSHLYLIKDKKLPRSGIKRLVLGGEELSRQLAQETYDNFNGNIEIYNEYGPTEATVGCMIYRFTPGKDNYKTSTIPIGGPVANTQIYLLDRNQMLVPIGVAGEIFISGHGITLGYLNRPELTAEKFDHDLWDLHDYHDEINKNFCGGPGGSFFKKRPLAVGDRIYKTGDLARWLVGGVIEFLGRIDHQVKIRGYRVELAEIQHRLLKNEQVKEAIVVAWEDDQGNKSLAAYFVSEDHCDTAELRAYLAIELPDYMLPSYFVQLERLPRAASGKIDRQQLPDPKQSVRKGTVYEEPSSDIEKTLATVWKEVLGLEKVGINENFFAIGGDSIKSIQLSSRLRKYRLKLDIGEIFLNQTIKQLGLRVQRIERDIDQGIVEGNVELVPIQHWFFQNHFANRHHYNHSVMLYRREGFSESIVQNVFTQIIIHHDALRMVYKLSDNQVTQQNRGIEGALFHLEVFNLQDKQDNCAEAITHEANRMQEDINLAEGPLAKLGIFKTNKGDHLVIIIHHLVMDGISWRILFEDFVIGYQQAEKTEAIEFQGKTDSFKYWARKLKEYSESNEVLEQLDYWKDIEAADIVALPKDYEIEKAERRVKTNEVVGIVLEEEETHQLLNEVNQAYNTDINDILLAALVLGINQWKGIRGILVNLEAHGRESIAESLDISRTVGWFTAQFPVLLVVDPSKELGYQLKFIKDTLRRIPKKGIGYGILRYLTPADKKRGITLEVEPEISFNYLGQFTQELQNDVFEISPFSPGENIARDVQQLYPLEISSILVEGKLRLSFIYNRQEFEKSSIEELARCYKENLLKIIKHCTARDQGELTPGDLMYSEIEIEDLEKLKDLVSEID